MNRLNYGALCLALGLCLSAAAQAQSDVRDSLFQQADATLDAVKEKKAFLLSPEAFRRGYALYKEAEEDLEDGKNLSSIRRDLKEAVDYFEKALDASKLGQVTFETVLRARADAEQAGARKYNKEKWNEAEAQFIEAAEELEGGDVKDAKREGAEAEKLYRNVELAAIKGHYLNETRETLKKADRMDVDDYAPKTYQKAKRLLSEAETTLTRNRYDIDKPRDLARQAKYEASHAIYLAEKLEAVDDGDMTMEELVLEYEKPLIHIGGAADIVAELDRGYEAPTRQIIAYIENLRNENKQLKQDAADMQGKMGNLASLKEREALRKEAERIERMFDHTEATVLRKGDDIILSLIGLNFGVGRAEIEADNFALLSKVKRSIESFPGCKLVVEGHTDSFGSDASNRRLSEKRAASVREYLLANMDDLSKGDVKAVGFGETRPVANNETPEGRQKNRRIDIIIQPSA